MTDLEAGGSFSEHQLVDTAGRMGGQGRAPESVLQVPVPALPIDACRLELAPSTLTRRRQAPGTGRSGFADLERKETRERISSK
jgi:hypothetical protein